MSRKMVQWVSSSLIAMGVFVIGCSESNTTEPQALVTKSVNVKNDATNMWARIDGSGSIADYFDSRSKEGDAPIIGATTRSNVQCKAPALQMDDNTRYLDELESLFEEGELVIPRLALFPRGDYARSLPCLRVEDIADESVRDKKALRRKAPAPLAFHHPAVFNVALHQLPRHTELAGENRIILLLGSAPRRAKAEHKIFSRSLEIG